MYKGIQEFVKSYDGCNRMCPLLPYYITLKVQVRNLFYIHSPHFSGLLPVTTSGYMYLFVAGGNLNRWPIVSRRRTATATKVMTFIQGDVLRPYGPPKLVISDDATRFTAQALAPFTEEIFSSWKTVLAYAPM